MPATLGEIAAVFLKLGLVAVGGPAVHVASMRREVVVKRRWLDEKTFLDDFAACQLIPGPSSTELAILLGYRRGGPAGLLVAGVLFVLPAMLIMLALAWVYSRFATSSVIAGALHGVRPVVVALITWALIDLGRRIVRGPVIALVGLAVMLAALFGTNPILLLALGGLSRVGRRSLRLEPLGPGFATASMAINTSLLGILLVFLKYGVVSFGSRYVLFAFLHTDVVQTYHWLTTPQLVDAIAISQATPGPVFTVATFIGYLVAGAGGALVATVGIFLPGFILVPFLERIVRLVNAQVWARAFLEGVNVAALGLIAAVGIELGRTAIIDPITAAIGVGSLAILWRLPLAAPALVIAGGLAGLSAGH